MTQSEQANLMQGVELANGISVLRRNDGRRGWNGISYEIGLSGRNVGSKGLSMNLATVPPKGIAYAHIHDGFEVMLYILQGRVRHAYGDDLKQEIINHAGDFIYIEPGVPHEVYNDSETEPLVAVVARSAADEWDRIIDYPSPTRP